MMDAELEVLQQEVRTRGLRLRDECTRACGLPSEILVNIFILLREMWLPLRWSPDGSRGESFTSGWMAVTHVCSKWRTVRRSADVLTSTTDRS